MKTATLTRLRKDQQSKRPVALATDMETGAEALVYQDGATGELAGDDDDAPRLLEAALDVATHRVVVKRPRKAPPIAGPAPQHVIEGKTSRYDLYVHRSLKA